MSDLHRSTGIAYHDSFTFSKISFIFVISCLLRSIFTSRHRCSMGFRSALDDGQSKTSMELSWKNFFVSWAVCFGSLSCWNFHTTGKFSSAQGNITFSKMSTYPSLVRMPSIRWIGPTPFHEKQPHTLTEPPPCFTTGDVYFRLNSFRFGHRTNRLPSGPIRLIFVSSLQRTNFHWLIVHDACNLANSMRFFRWFLVTIGFLRATRPWSPA